jgi:curved DNA-binding protein CbpA
LSEGIVVRERENHYAVLGVASSATAGEIRRAYLSLAKRFHPDRHHSKSVTIQYRNSERFKVIGEAYYILDDPASRRGEHMTLHALVTTYSMATRTQSATSPTTASSTMTAIRRGCRVRGTVT